MAEDEKKRTKARNAKGQYVKKKVTKKKVTKKKVTKKKANRKKVAKKAGIKRTVTTVTEAYYDDTPSKPAAPKTPPQAKELPPEKHTGAILFLTACVALVIFAYLENM